MLFAKKADYSGHYDSAGIPMLDYHGQIGLQYNPIAIAQWGLGNYNLFCRTQNDEQKKKFLTASDWLCEQQEKNSSGIWVWNHHFDWEYRSPLKAPWHSALAQGQGISLLVRAYRSTGAVAYFEAAERAFASFLKSTHEGGVAFTDERGNLWFEEYIVSPPTHILNGFIWAAWGVYDYFLITRSQSARNLFEQAVLTLRANLDRYDLGFWSLYEQSNTLLPMVASPFYHRLHVVQLRVMHRHHRRRNIRPLRRPMGSLYAQPGQAHSCSLLQKCIQALLLLKPHEYSLRISILSPGDGSARRPCRRVIASLGRGRP